MQMERTPQPESEAKNAKEVASALVTELLGEFTKSHMGQLKRGERGLVEQDLSALIDRSIAVARAEEGEEFAHDVGARFADEIEFCSAAFQDFAEMAKDAVRDAEVKYGLEHPAEQDRFSQAA